VVVVGLLAGVGAAEVYSLVVHEDAVVHGDEPAAPGVRHLAVRKRKKQERVRDNEHIVATVRVWPTTTAAG